MDGECEIERPYCQAGVIGPHTTLTERTGDRKIRGDVGSPRPVQ